MNKKSHKNETVVKHIHSPDVLNVVEKKIQFFQDLIQKTMLYVQKNKMLDILGVSEVTTCFQGLHDIHEKIKELLLTKNTIPTETLINNLQSINNDLSGIFKMYGTEHLEDLLSVCFGNNIQSFSDELLNEKFLLLKKYFHPTGYKVIQNKTDLLMEKDTSSPDKPITATPLLDEPLGENVNHLECYSVVSQVKKFHMKVYGVKFYLINTLLKKTILLFGNVDDVIVEFLMNNKYIHDKITKINNHLPSEEEFHSDSFKNFLASLTLKEYLVHNHHDLYKIYMGNNNHLSMIKQKPINQCVKEFIASDLFSKRFTLILLLNKSSDYENQYLAYLLYDLLSNDVNENVDTIEQTILFDSFPWISKQFFKDAMKKTIQYTNELSNFDINKIPLEQQICLMKASDAVKEKAMLKLKEVKAKSEDSGSKARQYLEGLLKIPFGVYRREPIMHAMEEIRSEFKRLVDSHRLSQFGIPLKDSYTSMEIVKYIHEIRDRCSHKLPKAEIDKLLVNKEKQFLVGLISKINGFLKTHVSSLSDLVIKCTHATKKEELKKRLGAFVDAFETKANGEQIKQLKQWLFHEETTHIATDTELLHDIDTLETRFQDIHDFMKEVKDTLDKSVYGHEKAKKQIERIVGQWINGKQDGYCFGFEGPPGVGKTTLAKRGLSDCLKDAEGNSRPFTMIQMGGDSNGSTLHGHNYTYVGSTWGSIVQILIDKKCMNPIIFIDEVDKISKTEHGREIVGILTHLLDSTQNDCFQDKYFNGIDLDLSKALFILSYNDVDAIDKILLDRIHRIQFKNLSLEDKLIIAHNHILPEVYSKMGLTDMIDIPDAVLRFIIEDYTMEAGVRKLKELLFEIVGEVNLDILKNMRWQNKSSDFPLTISVDDIKTKYFKDKREVKIKKIHDRSEVGIINCLWANEMGNGGILSATGKFIPAEKFLDLRLTGLLDEMMRESFHISLTMAYHLLNEETQFALHSRYDGATKWGIHMHLGDGSINKSGTSAGIAIAILFYSLLTQRKIRNDFAVTGEASDLNGTSGEIGALRIKIASGIKAGVKHFIYPQDNQRDFDDFIEKYGDTELVQGIQFHPISDIREALELILE